MQTPRNQLSSKKIIFTRLRSLLAFILFALSAIPSHWERCVLANDYLLTIGGGYEPAGNQASLEANVLFFQQIVSQHFPPAIDHQIFFADGFDSEADVQVTAHGGAGNGKDPMNTSITCWRKQSLSMRMMRSIVAIFGGIRRSFANGKKSRRSR